MHVGQMDDPWDHVVIHFPLEYFDPRWDVGQVGTKPRNHYKSIENIASQPPAEVGTRLGRERTLVPNPKTLATPTQLLALMKQTHYTPW